MSELSELIKVSAYTELKILTPSYPISLSGDGVKDGGIPLSVEEALELAEELQKVVREYNEYMANRDKQWVDVVFLGSSGQTYTYDDPSGKLRVGAFVAAGYKDGIAQVVAIHKEKPEKYRTYKAAHQISLPVEL